MSANHRPLAPQRLALNLLRRIGFVLAASGLGLVVVFMLSQGSLIFLPHTYDAADPSWNLPSDSGGVVEDVFLTTEDGVVVHGWYARGRNARYTLLFFHGNAGNVTHRRSWIMALTTLPANVLALDYRGYGRSEGSPSEEGIYRDAEAAWNHLVNERNCRSDMIVIYGKSLGGGAASWLAEEHAPRALILQSTFTSIPDMAPRLLPLLRAVPRSLLRRMIFTEFPNLSRVARISAPTLIIHSRSDEMIPFAMAEELHAASAGEPRRLRSYETEGHNDLVPLRSAELLTDLREFLDP